MNEILKAIGKEALKKIEEKMKAVKSKIQLTKNFVEMDIKLGEKIQFSFQIKKPEKTERGTQNVDANESIKKEQ